MPQSHRYYDGLILPNNLTIGNGAQLIGENVSLDVDKKEFIEIISIYNQL
jgi:hypothetical protein